MTSCGSLASHELMLPAEHVSSCKHPPVHASAAWQQEFEMHTGHWLFAAFRTELAAPQAPASSGWPPVSGSLAPLSLEPPLLPPPPLEPFAAQEASPIGVQPESTPGAPLLDAQPTQTRAAATHSSKTT